jgi:hypothetical protein
MGEGSCVVLCRTQEETKMLKLLYFVLTARRKCSYIRFNWRELELTKKIKPIVVSMGDAASGGYYIACNANTILPKITPLPVL